MAYTRETDVWSYNPISGELLQKHKLGDIGQLNPKSKKEEWLVPTFVTDKAPPDDIAEGFAAIFNSESQEWEVKRDLRGTVLFATYATNEDMSIGENQIFFGEDDIPDGYSETMSPERLRTKLKDGIRAEASRLINDGIIYEGKEYQTDAESRLRLGMPRAMNEESTIEWIAADNELVTLTRSQFIELNATVVRHVERITHAAWVQKRRIEETLDEELTDFDTAEAFAVELAAGDDGES